MASEGLFSVKRMLKEIKEKLSVSSGSGGTELTIGEVVEELKTTVESLQTTVNTVNTTVTEIKYSGGDIKNTHNGYFYFNGTAGEFVKFNNFTGYLKLYTRLTYVNIMRENNGKRTYISKYNSSDSFKYNMAKAYGVANDGSGNVVIQIPVFEGDTIHISFNATNSVNSAIYYAILNTKDSVPAVYNNVSSSDKLFNDITETI